MFTLLEPIVAATKPAPGEIPVSEECGLILGSVGVERLNIAETGKRFKAWFMTPGVVNYEDLPNGGKELMRKETIDDALETLVGAPLTLGHVPTNLSRDELIDRKNGEVDKVGFDAEKGWHYCEGTIETDQARDAIKSGHGISVGTRVIRFGPGGSWLNNAFDREITKLRFHHLAIVPPEQKPRYEDAAIRLNSTRKPMNIAKLIKKIVAGDKTSEQASDLPLDAKLDLGEGRTASVAEMLEVERNNHCHAVSPDDYIEHEGVRYHVGTLVHHFRQHCSMGHHQLEAERPHAGETPEAFAARRVKETADAVTAAKADLDKATERANAKDATEAEKKAAADAKARHDEATEAAAAATERLNSLSAIDAKVKAANEAQKAAEDKLAEAEKAKTDAEAARKNAEAERDNAKRRAGIESFSILATAADRGAIKRTFPAPSGGIANKLEKGRRLFGGAAVPSTAGKN